MKFIFSRGGFTLTEVAVGIGLTGIVGLGIATSILDLKKIEQTVSDRSALQQAHYLAVQEAKNFDRLSQALGITNAAGARTALTDRCLVNRLKAGDNCGAVGKNISEYKRSSVGDAGSPFSFNSISSATLLCSATGCTTVEVITTTTSARLRPISSGGRDGGSQGQNVNDVKNLTRQTRSVFPAHSLGAMEQINFDCSATQNVIGLDLTRREAVCGPFQGDRTCGTLPMRFFGTGRVCDDPVVAPCPNGIGSIGIYAGSANCISGPPPVPVPTPLPTPTPTPPPTPSATPATTPTPVPTPVSCNAGCYGLTSRVLNPTQADSNPSCGGIVRTGGGGGGCPHPSMYEIGRSPDYAYCGMCGPGSTSTSCLINPDCSPVLPPPPPVPPVPTPVPTPPPVGTCDWVTTNVTAGQDPAGQCDCPAGNANVSCESVIELDGIEYFGRYNITSTCNTGNVGAMVYKERCESYSTTINSQESVQCQCNTAPATPTPAPTPAPTPSGTGNYGWATLRCYGLYPGYPSPTYPIIGTPCPNLASFYGANPDAAVASCENVRCFGNTPGSEGVVCISGVIVPGMGGGGYNGATVQICTEMYAAPTDPARPETYSRVPVNNVRYSFGTTLSSGVPTSCTGDPLSCYRHGTYLPGAPCSPAGAVFESNLPGTMGGPSYPAGTVFRFTCQ